MKKLLPILLFVFSFASAQEKYFAYYGTWSMGRYTSWDLTSHAYYMPLDTLLKHRGSLTHIIIFPNNDILLSDRVPYLSCTKDWADGGGTTTDSINLFYNGSGNPSSGYTEWINRGSLPAYIDSFHAHSVKVMLCLNAVTPTKGWNAVVADSTKTQVLVNRLEQFLTQHGFDGVDINVEQSPTPDSSQVTRFYRLLRGAIGSKIISSVPPPTWHNSAKMPFSVIQYHDYILPQFYVYEMGWTDSCGTNETFLSAPTVDASINASTSNLHSIFCQHTRVGNVTNWGVGGWLADGWSKNQLVCLFTCQAMQMQTVDSIFQCAPSSREFWNDTCARAMLTNGGTETYDAAYGGAFIHGTAVSDFKRITAGAKFYIPILTHRNVDSILSKARALGMMNFGMYDIGSDAQPISPTYNPLPYVAYISSKLNQSASPTITLSVSSIAFGNVTVNTISSEQTYTISGAHLVPITGNITVTAPAGFEISKTTASGFASSITCAYADSILTETTIYAHHIPTTVQAYSGNLTHAGGGASTGSISLTGTGLAAPIAKKYLPFLKKI
jgi:hypothetical protein